MAGLEGLARSLTLETLELQRERERALASRTLTGHMRNALGYALSLYCLLRRGALAFCSACDRPSIRACHGVSAHACMPLICSIKEISTRCAANITTDLYAMKSCND